MLPTELQRILLLIGMAATAYLMILAWNEDYGQSVDLDTYEADLVTESSAEAVLANDSPTLSAAPEPMTRSESDAPDDSLLSSSDPDQMQPQPAPATTPDSDRLVHIETPMMRVWIDRLGGDVVRIQLPKFPVTLDRPDVPYLLLDNSSGRTYVAQTGTIGTDGIDKGTERPLYQSAKSEYLLTESDKELVVELQTTAGDLQVIKRFRFYPDQYLLDLDYSLSNQGSTPVQAALFAQIKRDATEPPGQDNMALGPRPYLGGALTTPDSRYEKIDFDDLDDDGPFRLTAQGGWIAFLQHYFLSAWIADPEVSNRFYAEARNSGTYVFGFVAPAKVTAPGASSHWRASLYAGPKDQDRLEVIAPNLNLTVDYGFLWWLAVPLFKVLKWLEGLTGNWGVAIILLTVLVKAILWPLSAKAYHSMANMRRVAPQMKRLQERHAGDRQKLSQEMMALYKKEGVNPLGGCLPMLLPMPIFLALYWVLFESIELRQAPFVLWIKDLSVMDPYFVLPLLMGASMFLQQLLSPAMGDPMQVRMMRLMPIMFTALFLFFPAGLVLYWLVNNVLSIAQQWLIIRKTDAAMAAKAKGPKS